MTVLVTPAEMRAAEAAAIDSGTPARELMRTAGLRIADWLERITPPRGGAARKAVGLTGPGNNGGDVLVALAVLVERGWECAAVFVGRAAPGELPASSSAVEMISVIESSQISSFGPHVIADGIYGIGSRPRLGDAARLAIDAARREREERGVPLVAIDLPSGTDGEGGEADPSAFPADLTVCLGLPKLGLIREPAASFAGELVVLDIGIPAPLGEGRPVMLDASQARRLAPRRAASAHKSTSGSLIVVGGADAYYGAPRLTGEAALRIGAGLVTLAVPEKIIAPIAAQVPELTFLPLSGDGNAQGGEVLAFLEGQPGRYDAVVVGPGLGRDGRANALLDTLMSPENRHFQRIPIVLDADGLNWLSRRQTPFEQIRHARCVLTPHAGEFARLRDTARDAVLDDPIAAARDAASAWGHVVVLKAGYSLVAAPDGNVWVAPRAMPELATAGTGDVLSGLIGGFLAQGLTPVDGARLAMFVGAMAGRRALGEYGVAGVVARDVVERVALVLRELMSPEWDRAWLTQGV